MKAIGLDGEWRAEHTGVGWDCKHKCDARNAFLPYRDYLPEVATKMLAWHCARCAKVNMVLVKVG